MLNQEHLHTEIPEVCLFVFAYRMFHKDFMKQFVGEYKSVKVYNLFDIKKYIMDLDPDFIMLLHL